MDGACVIVSYMDCCIFLRQYISEEMLSVLGVLTKA